tara:strand:- start:50 stop:847 length:798 start_codon:yes stop_codon:yes gene_type:complete
MGYRNLTILGKRDGFGCQLNAKLSGIAFCLNRPKYRYIHTPFKSVSHGWRSEEAVNILNDFIGIPDNRAGKRIHCSFNYIGKVFKDPNAFYNTQTLNHIREMYWSTPKPDSCEEEIVVHIRRGDVSLKRGGDRRRRFTKNEWYNLTIPKLASLYPDHYKIAIHSEGSIEDFLSITNMWPEDILQRTTWKLAKSYSLEDDPEVRNQKYSLPVAFHEMVTAKVLLCSKSALPYTAGLYSEGDVYHLSSGTVGQSKRLTQWKNARDLC